MRALNDVVIVERIEYPEQTRGQLYLPGFAREKTQLARILAIGPRAKRIDLDVGDYVVFDKYEGLEAEIEGRTCLVLRAHNCLLRIQGLEVE